MLCTIHFTWDEEACVWVASSPDVPGLALESGSFDALVEKVRIAVPELLALNGSTAPEYRLHYAADRSDVVRAYG